MEIKSSFKSNCLTLDYEFNDSEMGILNHVDKYGFLEFRNYEKDTLDSTKMYHRSETLQLVSCGFIEHDLSCIHTTYKLTNLGKRVFINGVN